MLSPLIIRVSASTTAIAHLSLLCLSCVCLQGGFVPCPVDADGLFTTEVKEWAGKLVKDADK